MKHTLTNVFNNDLPLVSNVFNMLMYADDTTLYCNNNEADVQEINSELKIICEWLSADNLSLSVKKTKFIIFHSVQKKVFILSY